MYILVCRSCNFEEPGASKAAERTQGDDYQRIHCKVNRKHTSLVPSTPHYNQHHNSQFYSCLTHQSVITARDHRMK